MRACSPQENKRLTLVGSGSYLTTEKRHSSKRGGGSSPHVSPTVMLLFTDKISLE